MGALASTSIELDIDDPGPGMSDFPRSWVHSDGTEAFESSDLTVTSREGMPVTSVRYDFVAEEAIALKLPP